MLIYAQPYEVIDQNRGCVPFNEKIAAGMRMVELLMSNEPITVTDLVAADMFKVMTPDWPDVHPDGTSQQLGHRFNALFAFGIEM